MKKLAVLVAAGASALAIQAADGLVFRALQGFDEEATAEKADSTGFVFTDVKVLPHTSVKDQNKSGTCWCFVTTSFLEDEILRQGGDSLDISEMFTVRQCYKEKAERYVRMYGQANFAAGGATPDVFHVWETVGCVPEEVYTGLNYGEEKHVHGELDAALKAYLDVMVSKPNKKLSPAWSKGVDGILDAYLGEVPETFTYKGKTYTPKSFAESLPVKMSDYVPFTSFSHHPFYTSFAIEVPDNWLWEKSVNVPMEEMKAIVDNALEKRLPRGMGRRRERERLQMERGLRSDAPRAHRRRHGGHRTLALGETHRQGAPGAAGRNQIPRGGD